MSFGKIFRWRIEAGKAKRQLRRAVDEYERDGVDADEMRLAYEDYSYAVSRITIANCARLGIPYPSPTYIGLEPEGSYWENVSELTHRRFLNRFGVHELEKVIHETKARRFEVVSRWVMLAATIIGSITGLVGALIGLLSIG
ncbi:hypothetical protein [Antarctobacter sp.]|uniref:hypothetical protein n=1 Tax=Antarctobacter sp. TaxID=1872577 RepID=UPI003A913769